MTMFLQDKILASGIGPGLAQAMSDTVDLLTAAGTTQADAYELRNAINRFSTVASGSGAKLWRSAQPGDEILVYNAGANSLLIYPNLGSSIDSNAVNASITLPAGDIAVFTRHNASLWSMQSTSSSDMSFIQSGTGAVATTAQAKMRQTVSVLDFGADNTGATDCAAAITAALAALPAAGGRLYFPAGTYKIASSITMRQNTVVYGDGMLNTIIAPTTAVTGAAFTLILGSLQTGALEIRDLSFSGNATTVNAISLKNLTLVSLKRLYFDGFSNASSEQVLLDFVEASNVQDCAFLNCRTNGLRLTDAANAFRIDGCTFTTTNSGGVGCTVDPSVAQVTISNCNFEGASAGNYGVAVNGSQAVTISGNFFEFWTGACIVANSGVATNLRIVDNHLHATSAASQMVALNSSGPNDRLVVENNLLALLGNSGTTTVGIDFGSSTNIRAIGNKSTGAGTGILKIGGVTQTAPDYLGFNGLLDISAANAGNIQFPAIQNSSSNVNMLDDYEEGTWVPVLTFATPGDLAVTYSTQVAAYTKIGRQVTVNFNITTSAFTWTTSSGNLNVTGLPFTSLSTTSLANIGALQWQGITKAGYTNIVARVGANVALITFLASGSGVNTLGITTTDVASGGAVVLNGTLTYFTAT